MISCIVEKCVWIGMSPNLLYGHLKRMHMQLDSFKCNVGTCDRTYSVLATFRLHHRKHFLQYQTLYANREQTSSQKKNNKQTIQSKMEINDKQVSIEESGLIHSPTTNISTTLDIDYFAKKIKSPNFTFALKWLSKENLPRKMIIEIQKDVQKYYIEPMIEVFKEVSAGGQENDLTERVLNELNSTCNYESEYMLIQQLKQKDLFCDPIMFNMNNELQANNFGNLELKVEDQIEGVLMPLKFLLRKYIESPGLFDCIVENLNPSDDGVYRSLIDGQVWKRRRQLFKDKFVIPLNIYFDDFNTSDTASNHAAATSICGIYLNVPCLPAYLLSKRNNILIAGFVKTIDRKYNDNAKLFCKLIDTLIELEKEGLVITSKNEKKRIYFALGFVLGDNLGINGITGFVESFRATYFCRVCKRTREQTENDCVEHLNSLREARTYKLDLDLQNKSITGLKEECMFHRLSYFHVCDNFVFDAMHDVLEGVLVYNLQHCLYHFIIKKQYLSTDALNRQKNTFVYGDLNSSNIPNDFVENKIKNKQIKMTASEMKTFWTFLPLIFGIMIPEEDLVWNFVKITLKLIHIIFLDEIPTELIEELKVLVKQHHNKYMLLFDDSLKPKFHFLTHYATAIQKSGCIRRNWAMRFEAKHRESKNYCRVNNNKKNLCYSLSIKSSYKFAYNVLNNEFFSDQLKISHDVVIKKLPMEYDFCLERISYMIDPTEVMFTTKIIKKGADYTKGCVFLLQKKNLINIYKCRDIVVSLQNNIIIFAQKYESINFNEHYQSYELKMSSDLTIVNFLLQVYSKPVNLYNVGSKTFLRTPNYYDCNTDIENTVIMRNI
ncbi:uncharacterized protein LOC131438942 [Malaya genurostris]|uniref:uncharacterized protein LOC131438942 n=1 Tax=Malaya genurostris TaxID=325434 RepID=UPI0026F3BAEF|nr:uncharacterized protein LOC131438942 [Malaya genurostris]XP_058465351.1 uncharacterized protein LOC131438942 [Malaya genurostris]